ncbi:hypothetical protein NHH03_18250 [Stieleria sp. TO1_6]|nr:hypothetical protein [Stieleria tagensis]
MPTAPPHSTRSAKIDPPNVAQRLGGAINAAKRLGFDVRKVVLNDQSPGWCQLGSQKILFLDLTATTSEQLHQIETILAEFSGPRLSNV